MYSDTKGASTKSHHLSAIQLRTRSFRGVNVKSIHNTKTNAIENTRYTHTRNEWQWVSEWLGEKKKQQQKKDKNCIRKCMFCFHLMLFLTAELNIACAQSSFFMHILLRSFSSDAILQ